MTLFLQNLHSTLPLLHLAAFFKYICISGRVMVPLTSHLIWIIVEEAHFPPPK